MASPRQDGMPRNIKSRVNFNLLIFSIFEKDQLWSNPSRRLLIILIKSNRSCRSFKKMNHDWIILLIFQTINHSKSLFLIFEKDWQKRMLSKTKPFAPKKHIFGKFLIVFPPFMPKEQITPFDLCSSIFFKDWWDWFTLVNFFFEKDQPWANWSRWSLKKMHCPKSNF